MSQPTLDRSTVTKVKKELRSRKRNQEMFSLLAATFRALGDPSRVQIVWALAQGPMSVGSIAGVLGMSQPAVSHHLRTLRDMRLVQAQKLGRTVTYSLDDEHIEHLLKEGIIHVEELIN